MVVKIWEKLIEFEIVILLSNNAQSVNGTWVSMMRLFFFSVFDFLPNNLNLCCYCVSWRIKNDEPFSRVTTDSKSV